MAASVSIEKRSAVPGAERYTVSNVTLDDAYVSGGYSISAGDLGLVAVQFAVCNLVEPSDEDPVEGAAYANGKLVCFTDGVETSAAQDLSGAVVQVVAYGR